VSEFTFKEVDEEGAETLDVISSAERFNRWMFETIEPFCTGRILEIGSGIGNISAFFAEAGANITLSDIRENYCSTLESKFKLLEIVKLDLVHPDFSRIYQTELEKFDTVFALNVVEHIHDDQRAIINAAKLLRPGGRLIILVPAYQALYNRFDKELEHYRRYSRHALNNLLETAGLRVQSSQHFNFMGIFGWFISGRMQRNKTIPGWQMAVYNRLTPLFKMIDKIVMHKAGLSVISVGLK
jgi:SAM-dependent methyltransferase